MSPSKTLRKVEEKIGNGHKTFSFPSNKSSKSWISWSGPARSSQQPGAARGNIGMGQMFSLETRQMSQQQSSVLSQQQTSVLSQQKTSILSQQQTCSVARTDSCLVSTHSVDVSEISTVPMFKSQKSQLWQCHNVQIADRRSGPKLTKMVRNGSRIVARS